MPGRKEQLQMMTSLTNKSQRQSGFTLVEMGIVLIIVALLLGGLLPTINSQVDQRHEIDTRKQLDDIQQALIGYAVINGRLPCPATSTSNGAESPAGGGNCTNFYNGYVPAATLGLSGAVSSSGLILDAWGNPIRYAVTSWNSASPSLNDVFTTANGMQTVGISNLTPTSLLVCSTATGISGSSCGSGNALTTSGVPAVIFSTGKNGAQGSAGSDEAKNLDNNQTFVSHLPAPSGATNGAFDDILIWISPNLLINRMVAAGKLP
jgi:prepilin-type N-terminal cleavage/methylation domain-containing protein